MRNNSMLQDHIVKKLNELENKSYTIAGNYPFNFDFSFCGNSSTTTGLCFKRICK